MPDHRVTAPPQRARRASAGLLASIRRLAKDSRLRSWDKFFRWEKNWIDQQHLELCRIPAPTFQEQHRADHLVEAFLRLGYPAEIDDAGNAVAPLILEEGLPFVAVTAHLDTVLAPRHPTDVSVGTDGTFHGPGVTDNGSGLAALLALGRAFRTEGPVTRPTHNLLFVANVAEEGEGNLHGMKYLCRHSPFASQIGAYLVLDGASVGHITAEALGSRRFEVMIEGRGGHSWNDFGRANPVHAMARSISLMADTPLPYPPRTTFSVGVIEGGSGVNSIAPVARAKVDIRSRSHSAIQRVIHSMEEALRMGVELENRQATEGLSNFRIREIGHRPAAPFRRENRMVDCLQAVDDHLKIRSRIDCGSTDANVPLAMGLPAVAIGAGGRGGNAHSPSEWFNPEGRELGLQRIALAVSLVLEGALS